MGRTIKIRVPGTSANCGPGFDCLGVSCTIYNDMELTLLQEPELQIFVEGEGADVRTSYKILRGQPGFTSYAKQVLEREVGIL